MMSQIWVILLLNTPPHEAPLILCTVSRLTVASPAWTPPLVYRLRIVSEHCDWSMMQVCCTFEGGSASTVARQPLHCVRDGELFDRHVYDMSSSIYFVPFFRCTGRCILLISTIILRMTTNLVSPLSEWSPQIGNWLCDALIWWW